MKRIIFALATLATLTATPAFAGLVDEVVPEKHDAGSRQAEGQVAQGAPSDNALRITTYPQAERPAERGR